MSEPDKQNAKEFFQQGERLYEQGKYKEAVEKYDQAIALDPENPEYHGDKGVALFFLEKYGEAIKCCDQAVALGSKTAAFTYISNKQYIIQESGLWEYDSNFCYLLGKEVGSEDAKKISQQLKVLWTAQNEVLKTLRVSWDDITEVGYYRSQSSFEKMISGSEKKLPSMLKLCTVSGANDSLEGKICSKFLEVSHDPTEQEAMLALQCSFSKRIGDLNQFRLYGKNADKEEGTGVCLVFCEAFFTSRTDDSISPISIMRSGLISEKPEEKETQYPKLPLYWVLYYDHENKWFYHTPDRKENQFSLNSEPKESTHSRSTAPHPREALDALKVAYKKCCDDKEEAQAWKLLIYLRHLVKDAAFRDEQELRMLTLHEFGDVTVKKIDAEKTASPLSTDYHYVLDQQGSLRKIIAGPKIKGFRRLRDEWLHSIAQTRSSFKIERGLEQEIKITQSTVPLA